MRELKPRPPRPFYRRPFRMFFLLTLLFAAVLVIERWRGQWALKRWKQQMAARGEVFEVTRLWPAASADAVQFSNRLHQLAGRPRSGLGAYAGRIPAIVAGEPGKFRRGSQ